MVLSRLAAAASGRVVGASTPVADLAYRAQDATPGSLFVCVRGATADGHDFAARRSTSGAVALVVEHELDLAVPQLVVPDTRVAMAQLAAPSSRDPSAELDVVGVTGTSGKTTTTFLVHAILAAAGRRPGLLGTIESRIGDERARPCARRPSRSTSSGRSARCSTRATAAPRSRRRRTARELGRLDGVRFAALGFTNLGQDHLDFHGTMERYFEAKRRLFDAERHPRPSTSATSRGAPGRRRSAGTSCSPSASRDTPTCVPTARAHRGGPTLQPGGLESHTRLHGRFNVENALGSDRARRGSSASRTTRSPRRSPPSTASRAASRPSTRASRSRSSSTTRTSPTRSRTCSRPRASSPRAA